MLLTTSLRSGSFENGRKRKLAKNIYSSSDFGWIYGLLIGILHLMSVIIRELQESIGFGLRGQKFIQQQTVSFANRHHEEHEEGLKNNHQINQINQIVHCSSHQVHQVHLVIKKIISCNSCYPLAKTTNNTNVTNDS